MKDNVTAIEVIATATVTGVRTRLLSIYNGAVAGTVELKDGSGGPTRFKLAMTAGQTCDLPGTMLFEDGIDATLTSTTSVSLVYQT